MIPRRTYCGNDGVKLGPRRGSWGLRWLLCSALFLSASAAAGSLTNVETVFLILMENVNWSALKGSPSAPYLNHTLLPLASYCEQYYTPPGLPGSLPNYLWLEAGTNFGVLDSRDPSAHTFSSTNHLVTLLSTANISWKTYQEDISGSECPVSSSGLYAAYHNPFVYFTDITSNASSCLSHIRPFAEFAADLTNNSVARYNFITPNLCHDMHNSSGCASADRIRNGDNWLAGVVPGILASAAFRNNGAIFITWDEGTGAGLQGPIGMVVLSSLAKGGGYASTNRYTHASTLRTMQEIFGVRPFLAEAAIADALTDLFSTNAPSINNPGLTAPAWLSNGMFQVTLFGLTPGRTTVVEASSELFRWSPWLTNIAQSPTDTFSDATADNTPKRFFRFIQYP